MSRRDIASYLGVAHETVSRSFRALAGWGLVQAENRDIELLDLQGLRALAPSTRRQVEDCGHAFLTQPQLRRRAAYEPRAS